MKAQSTRKERERAKTIKPLHQTTKAKPSGYAEKVNNTLRIKPGKCNLYLNEDIDLSIFNDTNKNTSISTTSDVDRALTIELFRAEKISQHRLILIDLCKSQNLSAPVYAWERWQARSKLVEVQLEVENEVSASSMDDVLPCNSAFVDQGLIEDLVRASFPVPIAQRISEGI
jgi:hypothetical protein